MAGNWSVLGRARISTPKKNQNLPVTCPFLASHPEGRWSASVGVRRFKQTVKIANNRQALQLTNYVCDVGKFDQISVHQTNVCWQFFNCHICQVALSSHEVPQGLANLT